MSSVPYKEIEIDDEAFSDAVKELIPQLEPTQRIVTCRHPFEKWHAGRPPIEAPGKPDAGIWYGFGASWIEWCLYNQFGMGGYVEELTLTPEKILRIGSLKEFDAFDARYSRPLYPLSKMMTIDWKLVEHDFHGVEINPYLYERRLTRIWYYGWDCASGVIWNKNSFLSRKLLFVFRPDQRRFDRVPSEGT